jgi:hypothetical protein
VEERNLGVQTANEIGIGNPAHRQQICRQPEGNAALICKIAYLLKSVDRDLLQATDSRPVRSRRTIATPGPTRNN